MIMCMCTCCLCVWPKFNMVFINNARGAMSSNIGIRAHMARQKTDIYHLYRGYILVC